MIGGFGIECYTDILIIQLTIISEFSWYTIIQFWFYIKEFSSFEWEKFHFWIF